MSPAPKVESKTSNPDKLPYWQWKDDSFIAQGKFSWLAFGEIFMAMPFYYLIASNSRWPWLIIFSFMSAPILLLRSEASIYKGYYLLRSFHFRKKSKKTSKIATVLSFLSSLLFSIWLVAHWRPELNEEFFYLKVLGIGVLGTAFGALFSTVIENAFIGLRVYTNSLFPSAMLGVTIATGVAAFSTGVKFAESTMVEALYLLGALFAMFIGGMISGLIASLLMPVLGLIFGISLRALYIRILATFQNFQDGVASFSQNWYETVLVTDIRHSPELLPKASYVSKIYSSLGILNYKRPDGPEKQIQFCIGLGYFLVAILYRWNIKASALIWAPIALGLSPTNWRNYTEMREQSSLTSDKWLFATSVAFLIGFVTILAIPYLPLDFIEALPKWMNSKTVTSFRPQPNTLRYVLLCLFSLTFAAQLFLALRMRTQHDKPLSSAADFTPYLKEELKDDLNSFTKQAKQLRRILKINTALAIFIIWVFALKFALDKWPNELQIVVWDWLKPLI